MIAYDTFQLPLKRSAEQHEDPQRGGPEWSESDSEGIAESEPHHVESTGAPNAAGSGGAES